MASTPTTKSQVQAYRFVLRRMQSALVRRDAVMLHDPMRTHSRATAVGVLLGVIGLIGFLIFGFFSPDPQVTDDTQIAISKETGQVYVVRGGSPRTLIPMTNLASARLLLLQQQNPDSGTEAQAGGDAAAGAVNQAPQVAGGEPKLVTEKALSKLAKGRLTGIPDGPDVLPAPADRIGSDWSVCDTLTLDESLNDPTANNKFTTTVLAGYSGGGELLDGNRALLVRAATDDKQAYLIYKAPVNSKVTSTSTVRAKVDLADAKVLTALNLNQKKPRIISSGLLNAIPEAKPLVAPEIDGRGQAVTYVQGENLKVGDVIEVARTGADPVFYVTLRDGLQEISRAAGDLIRSAYAQGADPKRVDIARINSAKTTKQLDFDDYPTEVPDTLEANQNNRVVCLGWQAQNVGSDNKSQHTKVTIAPSLPVPSGVVPVTINQVGATGEVVSQFVMAPGKAAVVRSATSTQDFTSGPIHLITGRGVKYGVPDVTTAAALGLGADGFTPGPESILRLLPNGPQLNRNDAARSWDSIPVPKNNGLLPEEQAKKQGG
ncbi:type VII secretion protein EccB [Saccharothrix yanglingensis]|uniref:Type VII secretion protein EccB n=1 Tax=Saccharothrix yanglingensis TaxID=659496 RepID=A0ABU0WRZ0_9PSEU|nr:type VII secretion protein EccB [Saccharothrix yanglingensis]MDQ2582522.1 type VII secretion protein EccB [Saccharothrix yanglingensis]